MRDTNRPEGARPDHAARLSRPHPGQHLGRPGPPVVDLRRRRHGHRTLLPRFGYRHTDEETNKRQHKIEERAATFHGQRETEQRHESESQDLL
jgi:hypothetical protein